MTQKKKTLIIISASILTFLLLVGSAAAIIYSAINPLYQTDCFENTLNKLFIDSSKFNELVDNWEQEGYDENISLYLPDEFTGLLKSIRLTFNNQSFGKESGIGSVNLNVKVGNDELPLSLIYNRDMVVIGGLEEDYITFPRNNVQSALENSIFAPGSGSAYSLERSSFDRLVKTIEEISSTNNEALAEKEQKELKKAFRNILYETQKHIYEKSKVSSAESGVGFVRNVEYKMDKKTMAAFFDAVATEAEANKTLDDLIGNIFYIPSDENGPNREIQPLSSNFGKNTGNNAEQIVYGRDALIAIASEFEEKFEALEIVFRYTTDGEFVTNFDILLNVDPLNGAKTEMQICTQLDFDKNKASLASFFTVCAESEGEAVESSMILKY